MMKRNAGGHEHHSAGHFFGQYRVTLFGTGPNSFHEGAIRRYIGGLLFFFGVACLISAVMQPVTEGTGIAVAFIVFGMVIPGAIWLFRTT